MQMDVIEISLNEYKFLLQNSLKFEMIKNFVMATNIATADDIRALLGLSVKKDDDLPWIVPIPAPTAKEPDADPEEKKEKKVRMTDFIPAKKKQPKDLKKLRSLLDAGWTQAQCADEFGVSPSTICLWAKEEERTNENKAL